MFILCLFLVLMLAACRTLDFLQTDGAKLEPLHLFGHLPHRHQQVGDFDDVTRQAMVRMGGLSLLLSQNGWHLNTQHNGATSLQDRSNAS
jgi:hypothetical protein